VNIKQLHWALKMVVPLSEVPQGSEVTVVSIETGEGLKRRLLNMGLTPGTKVKVVVSGNHIVISLRGSMITLSKGVASKIFVEQS